jgi:mono/diheme cytochrome c family protein/rhodanese-related sulfurtransferase
VNPPSRRRWHSSVRLLTVLALSCALSLLSGCRRARAFWHRHVSKTVAVQPVSPARIARGRTAYVRYCALCHRADATGYAADHANAIGNSDFLAIASNAFLHSAIADGRPGTPMSAWGRAHAGPLDDATVDDIVAYLRSLSHRRYLNVGLTRVDGDAERGRPIWYSQCQSCHGLRGEGSARATSLSHPNFQRTASNGFIRYTIEHGRRGTAMTSFASLGSQSINDLVAFIRTLEHTPTPVAAPVYEPPPGLDQLIINPTGRSPEFTLREGRYVPAADVLQAMQDHKRLVILDARPTSDWNNGHVTGSLPFPFYNVEEMASRLPHDGTWILAYCACPHAASGHVVDELRRRHFEHTAVIDEGIGFWMSHGYPTARSTVIGTTDHPRWRGRP